MSDYPRNPAPIVVMSALTTIQAEAQPVWANDERVCLMLCRNGT